ncbi:MAG: FAD-dependent oxidoreductase [Deltaproteobacteria bacterium]|nr:FAD-dependent oxidoreductase [Deltaproteobacteria bacterium]
MEKKVTETQVAIIGGGITGTMLARELSKYRVDTCLIEKEPSFGFGITKGSQGLIHGGIAYLTSRVVKFQGGMDFKDYLRKPFNLRDTWGNLGRSDFFELAPALGLEIHQPGRLLLAESREDFEMIDVIKSQAELHGIKKIDILDRKQIEDMEPLVNKKYIGGLFDPNEAAILPADWAIGLAENAAQNGTRLYTNTVVGGIEEKKGRYVIRTNNGDFEAEYVVNAAGFFADDIANMVSKTDYEVRGWKTQLLVLENRDFIRHILALVPHPQKGRLLIPTTHNSILVAHSNEPMASKEDWSTTSEQVEYLMGWPREMVPEITPRSLISNFSGYLLFNTRITSDHILESPKRGFINAIVGAPGLGPAPAMARDIIRMLGEEGLELVAKSDFNPCRVREPRFIDLPEKDKNALIASEPGYGHMVCRCMHVSEQEIRATVRAGAGTLDEVKFRTLAGMGRCQGGFCTSRVLQIMSEELNVSPREITKKGRDSYILKGTTKSFRGESQERMTYDHAAS